MKERVEEIIGASVEGQFVRCGIRVRGGKKDGAQQYEVKCLSCADCKWRAWVRYTAVTRNLRIQSLPLEKLLGIF